MSMTESERNDLVRRSVSQFFERRLPPGILSRLEKSSVNGDSGSVAEISAILHEMLASDDLGISLLALPEEYGLGGVSLSELCSAGEELGRHDLGIATGVLASLLAAAPVFYGGTEEQKKNISNKLKSGSIGALAATEASGGSSLSALGTKAERKGDSYKLNGSKQWITNSGIADFYLVLAQTSGGASWFILDKDSKGLSFGQPEKKHGQHLSITADLYLGDVDIPFGSLVGGHEGNGLKQADSSFGFTRMIVASMALGAGESAIDDALKYSVLRHSGGVCLADISSYMNKLIVPHAARLAAIRHYLHYVNGYSFAEYRIGIPAANVYSPDFQLGAEAALAKFFAAEECFLACNDSVQACGGTGISRDFAAGKRLADCRPLLIYEGADEILKISLFRRRWQQYLKSGGKLYSEKAERLYSTGNICNAAYRSLESLSRIMEILRRCHLTREKYVCLMVGELIAWTEISVAFSHFISVEEKKSCEKEYSFMPHSLELRKALSGIFARETYSRIISAEKFFESMDRDGKNIDKEVYSGFFDDFSKASSELISKLRMNT